MHAVARPPAVLGPVEDLVDRGVRLLAHGLGVAVGEERVDHDAVLRHVLLGRVGRVAQGAPEERFYLDGTLEGGSAWERKMEWGGERGRVRICIRMVIPLGDGVEAVLAAHAVVLADFGVGGGEA